MKEQDLGVKWFNTIFYPTQKTGRAYRYEDGVLPRLRKETVTLFTPWGPRYSWETRGCEIQQHDKEVSVIQSFNKLLQEWQTHMPSKQFNWVFLAADLYGSKINNLPKEVVNKYFLSLKETIEKLLPQKVDFRFWSEFDTEAEPYRAHVRKHFDQLITTSTLARAADTARNMNSSGNPKDYLIERVAEALLIEEKYSPIKISAVGRHKNEGVDANLPCLYFLPPQLHAPWF